MNDLVIEITGLSKWYGDRSAVDNLDLSIRKGEIFGLLGPNGAGKSTVILSLLGLTEPDAGNLSIAGINPTRQPIEVKKMIGYLPEDIGFYEDMTGLENLIYTARLNRIPRTEALEKAAQLMQRVGLARETEKKAGKYSRGMRQRLGLAEVLIKDPQIIILDEPTLGIDPTGVREFLDLIVRLSREEGLTVLLSSHHLHQIQQICDRMGLFVNGKLLAEGNIQQLSQKLLAHSPFIIDAGITAGSAGRIREDQLSIDWLKNVLGKVQGIKKIERNDKMWSIECMEDRSREIADAVVGAGAGLFHLSKREYGLDDIYYRYFDESTEDHE